MANIENFSETFQNIPEIFENIPKGTEKWELLEIFGNLIFIQMKLKLKCLISPS